MAYEASPKPRPDIRVIITSSMASPKTPARMYHPTWDDFLLAMRLLYTYLPIIRNASLTFSCTSRERSTCESASRTWAR